MELPNPAPELDNLQNHFIAMVKKKLSSSGDGTIMVHKDADFTENPMEREDLEVPIKVFRERSLEEF